MWITIQILSRRGYRPPPCTLQLIWLLTISPIVDLSRNVKTGHLSSVRGNRFNSYLILKEIHLLQNLVKRRKVSWKKSKRRKKLGRYRCFIRMRIRSRMLAHPIQLLNHTLDSTPIPAAKSTPTPRTQITRASSTTLYLSAKTAQNLAAKWTLIRAVKWIPSKAARSTRSLIHSKRSILFRVFRVAWIRGLQFII